jgi:hypothetical protein
MVFDRIAARVPTRLARGFSIGATVLGLTGTILILIATAYGNWWVLAWAAGAFLLAGVSWQVAERLVADLLQH